MSFVGVHADAGYLPGPQVVHVLQVVPFRNVFPVQLAHWVAAGPVHVAQLALHAAQTRFAVGLHADTSYWFAPHALHAVHTVSAFALHAVVWYWPAPHVVQERH